MSRIVNVCYGLYQGDRLTVISKKGRKIATVVKEYPYHIHDGFWRISEKRK